MTPALVALAVVLLVGLAVWAGRHVKHPEQTASHARTSRDSDSERFYSDTDRPAGPDADEPVLRGEDRPTQPPG